MDSKTAIVAAIEPAGKIASGRRRGVVGRVLEAQRRERAHLVAELTTVKGLMPLMMKRRNGLSWSRAERIELHRQLRAVGNLSPYLLLLALPGSFIMLPVLAWWLDRRRRPRRTGDLPSSLG